MEDWSVWYTNMQNELSVYEYKTEMQARKKFLSYSRPQLKLDYQKGNHHHNDSPYWRVELRNNLVVIDTKLS